MQKSEKEIKSSPLSYEGSPHCATEVMENTITSGAKRSRSKSEETAMILTSLSQANYDIQALKQLRKAKGTSSTEDQCHLTARQGDIRGEQDTSVCTESGRSKNSLTKQISLDELRAHFDRPIIEVAKKFGICITLMKKICRRNGIKRWPHRQIRSLTKSIAALEAAMLSANETEQERYQDQIMNLRRRRESVIANPNKFSMAQILGDQQYAVQNKEDASRSRPPSPIRADGATSSGLSTLKSRSNPASPNLSKLNDAAQCSPLIKRPNGASSLCNTMAGKVATLVHSAQYLDASDSSKEASNEIRKQRHCIAKQSKGGRWTSEEHAAFLVGIRCYGKDWRRVAQIVKTRNPVQTRTHAQKYLLKFSGRYANEQSQTSQLEAQLVSRSLNSKAAARNQAVSDVVCCDDTNSKSKRIVQFDHGAGLAADQTSVLFDSMKKELVEVGSPTAATALCMVNTSNKVPCIL